MGERGNTITQMHVCMQTREVVVVVVVGDTKERRENTFTHRRHRDTPRQAGRLKSFQVRGGG